MLEWMVDGGLLIKQLSAGPDQDLGVLCLSSLSGSDRQPTQEAHSSTSLA